MGHFHPPLWEDIVLSIALLYSLIPRSRNAESGFESAWIPCRSLSFHVMSVKIDFAKVLCHTEANLSINIQSKVQYFQWWNNCSWKCIVYWKRFMFTSYRQFLQLDRGFSLSNAIKQYWFNVRVFTFEICDGTITTVQRSSLSAFTWILRKK